MKNNDVKLIGLCGEAQVGKDSAAQCMTQTLIHTRNELFEDHVIATESFAAPIKNMVAMLLDFFGYGSVMNPAQLAPYIEGEKKEEVLDKIGKSTRQLMQTLGTEWGRGCVNKNLWLNSMEERIGQYGEAKNHGHKGAFVFITDVRYENEAEMIRRNGGTMVRVTTTRDLGDVATHISEGGIPDRLVDATIANDGTLEDLAGTVVNFLEALLEEQLEDDSPPMIVHIPDIEDEIQADREFENIMCGEDENETD
jgi:hypothetical protein